MDADRIDYLLRTAHHAGLPYGSLDIDYILSQLRKDCLGKLCLGKKAVRAADHFFLCRYFDYTQVVFHKVVAGLEWVLEEVIGLLLRDGLDLSADGLRTHITNGTWSEIDDTFIVERARRLFDKIKKLQPDNAALIECIVSRRPPVTIFAEESIEPRDSEQTFQHRVKQIDSALPGLISKFGLSQQLVHRWKRDLLLTEIGSKIPVSDMMVSAGSDGLAEAVLVEEEIGKPARPIMNLPYSLMKVLSDQQYRALRVYAVVPDSLRGKVDEMRTYFRQQVD